jgi:hypothetical protein
MVGSSVSRRGGGPYGAMAAWRSEPPRAIVSGCHIRLEAKVCWHARSSTLRTHSRCMYVS